MTIEGFKIHFVGPYPLKPRDFQPLASLFKASIEIHQNLQSLGESLSLTSHPRQIILLERGEKTNDLILLSFARVWPTIVIERNPERGPNKEKKHCYWKLNSFVVGAALNHIPLVLLKMAFDGLKLGGCNGFDYVPWNAARIAWNIERDSTKKLSTVFEDFFTKTLDNPKVALDAIEFAKFSQNRAKGRGTFKTKSIHAIQDGKQVWIIADLNWFNKSEVSLRTVYSSIKNLKFDFALISSSSHSDLQIIARFPLGQEDYRQILMVAGMPGVKIHKLEKPLISKIRGK